MKAATTNAALCPRKRRPRPSESDAELEAAATDDGSGREKKSARSEEKREDASTTVDIPATPATPPATEEEYDEKRV